MNAPAEPTGTSLAGRAADAFSAYRAGRPEGMEQLVDLLTPLLWHTARAQRADQATAEDVVQTAWLRLVDRSDSVSEPQAVLQWMLTTVRREAWAMVRRQGRNVPASEKDDTDASGHPNGAPEAVAILSERQRVLWRNVAKLSERCREMLRVIAFGDRPDYAAIAEALGMPVGSIGPTRGRCLQKLRTALQSDTGWAV